MSESENNIKQEELTCKPLDSYEDILDFLQNPPTWRTLCIDLKEHSQLAVNNIDIINSGEVSVEHTSTFCHFNPETEEVVRTKRDSLPKTLVCHDMANGYHEDSFVEGAGNAEAYTFPNWAALDMFCYFSHHLVTIPPLGWINAAHAHGVQVLGTMITEWSDGTAFWERVLQSEEEMEFLANALVAIANTLKFDGWLLNIENKVSQPQRLVRFVARLHSLLHAGRPNTVLLWYDSVTVGGELVWQNELNKNNKAYFDACDGIFTNYAWSEENVRASAASAGARLKDVFIGIDVWGRNFYGGGEFNTQAALKMARRHGCSAAVFAPAWTHEAAGADGEPSTMTLAKGLTRYERYLLRDRALWGSLWPLLNTKLPCQLPFQTSFCRGQGKKRRLYGEVISPQSWYNLRHMQYQPSCAHGPHGYTLTSVDDILRVARESTNEIDQETAEGSTKPLDLSPPKNNKRKMRDVIGHFLKLKSSKRTQPHKELDSIEHITPRSESLLAFFESFVHFLLGKKGHKSKVVLTYVAEESQCLEYYWKDSFIGGSCLKINPSDACSDEHRWSKIFHTDFYFEECLAACVVTKNYLSLDGQYLDVILHVVDDGGEFSKIVLSGCEFEQNFVEGCSVVPVVDRKVVEPLCDVELKDLQRYLLLNQPGFYVPVENLYGWNVRYYSVKMRGARLLAVSCRTARPRGAMLFGRLGLCTRPL